MKNKGIVRNLEPLGRIVLPIEIRKSLNIKAGDSLEIFINGSSIILKKPKVCCVVCSGSKNLVEFEGKLLCKKCRDKIVKVD